MNLDLTAYQKLGHTETGFWFKVLSERPAWFKVLSERPEKLAINLLTDPWIGSPVCY